MDDIIGEAVLDDPWQMVDCLVSDHDGHVPVLAGPRRPDLVPTLLAVLRRCQITGWHRAMLPLPDAIMRHVTGHGCDPCRFRMACGCEMPLIFKGMCPHGSEDIVQAALRDVGRRQ